VSGTPPAERIGAILSELSTCLARVDDEAVRSLCRDIRAGRRLYVAGAGRTGFAMRAFAVRLVHLGLSAFVVGEATAPPIEAGDLLIVGSGSGRTEGLQAVARRAREHNARIALISASSDSPLSLLSDSLLIIPAPTPKAPGQPHATASIQPMGTLFEQALLLVLDASILVLMEGLGVSADEMFARHANLE